MYGDMSFKTFLKISEYFHLAQRVHLSVWGEPLLHPKLFDMIKIAKKAKCITGFTTNASLLEREIARDLINLNLDTLIVSIDGASSSTYESIRKELKFDKVIANVRDFMEEKKKLKSKKPEVYIAFLVNRVNYHELPLMVDLAKDLGIKNLSAINLYLPIPPYGEDLQIFACDGENTEVFSVIEAAKRKAEKRGIFLYTHPTGLRPTPVCEEDPTTNICFTWEGYVSPCVYLAAPLSEIERVFCGKRYKVKRTYFGDINNEDLHSIWRKPEYAEFRSYFLKRLDVFKLAGYSYYRHYGYLDMDELKLKEKKLERLLEALPLPPVCKTCYRAYGV